MEALPDELLVAILQWVPLKVRAQTCWFVCARWNRLLRDDALFGWACAQCPPPHNRKSVAQRVCEADWCREHICHTCAFPTERINGRSVVNWRAFSINHLQRRANYNMVYVFPFGRIRIFYIEMPLSRVVDNPPDYRGPRRDWFYEPISESHKKSTARMFIYNAANRDRSIKLYTSGHWPRVAVSDRYHHTPKLSMPTMTHFRTYLYFYEHSYALHVPT